MAHRVQDASVYFGVGGWMHFATLAGISDIDLGISRLVLQIRYVISEIS